VITRIKAENILSWENLEFDFSPGITSIEGFNYDDNTSEGSGKSSILNALCWGLFGKIPKDAKVDDVIRVGQDSAKVEVFLIDGSVVVRSRKPNELYLVKNGVEQRGKDSKETQLMIERKVGLSFESFCQAVYFAQNYPKKFISATEKERADIISEIQDLKQFDTARKKVMESLTLQANKISKLESRVGILSTSTSALQKQILDLRGLVTQFNDDKQRDLEKLENEILAIVNQSNDLKYVESDSNMEELSVSLNEIIQEVENQQSLKNATLVELKTLESKKLEHQKYLNKVQASKTRIASSLSLVQKKLADKTLALEEFIASPKKHCPTCGSVIDESNALKHQIELRTELSELEKTQAELKSELSEFSDKSMPVFESDESLKRTLLDIESALKECKLIKSNIENEIKAVEKFEARKNELSEKLDFLNSRKVTIEEKVPDLLLNKISECESVLAIQLDELASQNQALLSERDHDSRLRILKDGFKSVKAFVFGSVLEELTRISNGYISELFEVPVQIEFNNENEDGELSKIDIQVTIEGVKRPLGLYSGGQFKRIELAVDLALSNIISSRSNNPFNIRCFDEPFQNLSESSMEKAIKLFGNLKGTTLLIEHNSIAKSICDQVFKIELRDGVSRRVS
jgi:DNA repair exonuclease SbcCD ATPase subunit